jgi:hypothetical protein
MCLDPSEKRPGIMKADTDAGIGFEVLQEREIRSFVRPFEDVFKITTRLMRVNEQNEMEILGHGGSFFSLDMITRRGIL